MLRSEDNEIARREALILCLITFLFSDDRTDTGSGVCVEPGTARVFPGLMTRNTPVVIAVVSPVNVTSGCRTADVSLDSGADNRGLQEPNGLKCLASSFLYFDQNDLK